MNARIIAVLLRLGRVAGSLYLPDFTMAAFFWITWLSPYALGSQAPLECRMILLLEFIIVHFSVCGMATIKNKGYGWLLMVIYAPLVVGLALLAHTVWPIVIFAWHAKAKISEFDSASEKEKTMFYTRIAITVALYMVTIFAAFAMPDLGWQRTTVESDLAWENKNTGELIYSATPAWGTMYFFMLGVLSLFWTEIYQKIDAWRNKIAAQTGRRPNTGHLPKPPC